MRRANQPHLEKGGRAYRQEKHDRRRLYAEGVGPRKRDVYKDNPDTSFGTPGEAVARKIIGHGRGRLIPREKRTGS